MEGQNKPALVSLSDRREIVIRSLSTHFANDVIGMDEFERRIDLAHRALSIAALDELVGDLESAAPTGASLATREESVAVAVPTRAPPKKRVLSVLSAVQRKGTWRVPAKLRVRTLMGAVELDFREAELGPGVTEIKVRALMGAVSITVPPDLQVECDGLGLLGVFESLDQKAGEPDPDAPFLRIRGTAIMGALEIAVLRPGEAAGSD